MNTAVLVIDMQNDFVLPGAPLCVSGAKATLPAIVQLLDHARRNGWAVVHIIRQHDASGCDAEPFRRNLFVNGSGFCVKGTRGAEIVDELQPKNGDYQVVKTRFSGFFKTELHQLLQRLNIKRLVLAGTQYPNCIRATAVDAISFDYETVVCTDACSAATPEVAAANIYDLEHMGIDCISLKTMLTHINSHLDKDNMKKDNVWQRMVSGEIYDAANPSLIEKLVATREKIYEFNLLRPTQLQEQRAILRELLGSCGEEFLINQPFRCDYGCNIHIGERFFANFNFTVLDEAPVTIGNDAFIGPNVSIYTACHSTDVEERNSRREWAEPVTIGDNVWIGGSVTILPGVTIGNGVTIGAGSVVTKNVPDNVVVAGNPAKIIKQLK